MLALSEPADVATYPLTATPVLAPATVTALRSIVLPVPTFLSAKVPVTVPLGTSPSMAPLMVPVTVAALVASYTLF